MLNSYSLMGFKYQGGEKETSHGNWLDFGSRFWRWSLLSSVSFRVAVG